MANEILSSHPSCKKCAYLFLVVPTSALEWGTCEDHLAAGVQLKRTLVDLGDLILNFRVTLLTYFKSMLICSIFCQYTLPFLLSFSFMGFCSLK